MEQYYLCESADHWYCVPMCNPLTNMPDSVVIGSALKFKYSRNLNFDGVVKFISSSEDEVSKEINRLKGLKKVKKEGSFHSDRPRKAALRQRDFMIDMTRSSKSKKSERKDRDKSDKKVKERLRKSAAKVTEEELTSKSGRTELDEKPIEQPSVVPDAPVSSIKSEPNDDTDDLKLDSKPVTNDSDSSYDDSKISTAPLNVSKLEDLNNGKEEASNSASVNPSISSENGETIPNAQPNQGSPALKSPPHDPESDSKIVTEKRKSRRSRKKSKKSRSRRYVSSDSGSDSSSIKVKSHRKKKSKRASSSDSSTSSSSSSSSQSSSSTSSDSSEASKKRKRRKRAKKSKKTIVKRNLKIYQPTNYLCNSSTPGAVKLQDPYEVYILQSDLTEAINNSSSVTQFIRQLTPKVYTQDALTNATPQGYPDRSKGRKYCGEVLPRLHRDGRSAILARARALENEKKSWRPRAGESTLKNAFSNIVHKFKDDVWRILYIAYDVDSDKEY